MNLNFSNSFFSNTYMNNKVNFKGYNQAFSQDTEEKIKFALSIIKNNDLTADIGTISSISSLKPDLVYNFLFDSDNYQIYEQWQTILRQNTAKIEDTQTEKNKQKANEIRHSSYHPNIIMVAESKTSSNPSATTPVKQSRLIANEIAKIESAITEILNNPNLEADIDSISQITGIPSNTVLARLYRTDSNIYNFWQYTKSVKEDDTLPRRKRLSKFYGIEDKTIANIKIKNTSRALKMIKEAVATRTKISYQSIERATGLDKSEIDELIVSYAKSRQEQAKLKQENKKLQARWYEEKASAY